ncbi:uncharacterized protein [Canis lupus baileyi]|uniref:uncharacterized protein n=1 Tax=Canis lupus baileyi TaxID=143281 RepID=UPI003B96B1AA
MGRSDRQGAQGHSASRELPARCSLGAQTPSPDPHGCARKSFTNESDILAPCREPSLGSCCKPTSGAIVQSGGLSIPRHPHHHLSCIPGLLVHPVAGSRCRQPQCQSRGLGSQLTMGPWASPSLLWASVFLPVKWGFRTVLQRCWKGSPCLDHNLQGVTDATMSPHPTLQQDTVEETEAAGDHVREGLCVHAWSFPWFSESIFYVTHFIPYVPGKKIYSALQVQHFMDFENEHIFLKQKRITSRWEQTEWVTDLGGAETSIHPSSPFAHRQRDTGGQPEPATGCESVPSRVWALWPVCGLSAIEGCPRAIL